MTYKDKIVSINDNKLARFTMDIELSDNITKTKDGYLLCKNVIMGRTGYQKYFGYELVGFDFEPNEIVEVLREESEVFSEDTMNSANGKPVTLGHPNDAVNIDNIKELGKGSILGVPKRVGDNLVGDIIITDKHLIKLVEKKKLRELSLGYQTLLKLDNNVVRQTDIYINHLAVVENGRAENAMIIDENIIKKHEGGNVVDLLKDKTLNITINLSDLLKKEDEKEKVEEEKEVKKEDEDTKEEVEDEKEVKEKEKVEETKKEKEITKDMKAEDLIKLINEMNDEQKNAFKSFIGDAQVKTNAFTTNKQVNNEPTMVNDYSTLSGDERDKYLQQMHDSKFSFKNMYKNSNGNSVDLKRVIYQAKDIEVKDLIGGIK